MALEWKQGPHMNQADTSLKAAYVLGKRPDGKYLLFIRPMEPPRTLGAYDSEEEAIKAAEEDAEKRGV